MKYFPHEKTTTTTITLQPKSERDFGWPETSQRHAEHPGQLAQGGLLPGQGQREPADLVLTEITVRTQAIIDKNIFRL